MIAGIRFRVGSAAVAANLGQGGADGVVVAGELHVGQPLELVLLGLGVDPEELVGGVVTFGELVDTDHDPFARR